MSCCSRQQCRSLERAVCTKRWSGGVVCTLNRIGYYMHLTRTHKHSHELAFRFRSRSGAGPSTAINTCVACPFSQSRPHSLRHSVETITRTVYKRSPYPLSPPCTIHSPSSSPLSLPPLFFRTSPLWLSLVVWRVSHAVYAVPCSIAVSYTHLTLPTILLV